jgi:hypothetical protein
LQAIDIISKVPEMRQHLKSLEQKNVMLNTMTKVAASACAAAVSSVPQPVDASDAASDWEGLVAALSAHEGRLDQQKEELAKQVLFEICTLLMTSKSLSTKVCKSCQS